MIRICRIIYSPMVLAPLNLEGVIKIEIKRSGQKFRNPLTKIYIYLNNDISLFHAHINNLINWATINNNNVALSIAHCAFNDNFIKESAYDDFDYPMPKKYKELCEKYSQEFFNKYGELAKLAQTT